MSLEQDVRHFAQVLPPRALQTLLDDGDLPAEIVGLNDIHHANVAEVLLNRGVDCEAELRPFFEGILLEQYIPFHHPNTYDAIEPEVRGYKNPLIEKVRDTIQHVLLHGR